MPSRAAGLRRANAAGREPLIENRDKNGVGQAIFSNTYDALSNRLSVLELDGTRATFSYDAASQLVAEARGGTMAYASSYVWDPLGNRIQQYDSGVLTTRKFSSANGLLTVVPPTGPIATHTLDANGNEIAVNMGGALTTHSWSPENKLLVSSLSDGTLQTNTYSDDGLRKKKTVGSTVTAYTWDDMNVLLETDNTNALQCRYTTNPNNYGGLASQRRGATSSFYGFDSAACARILAAISGAVTDNYSNTAFGVELQSGSGTTNSRRFAGEVGYERDRPNWMQVGQRPYDALNGRWPTPDQIGFAGADFNLKRYVRNNPTVWLDPAGLEPYTGNCKRLYDAMEVACKSGEQRSCSSICNPGQLCDCAELLRRTIVNSSCATLRIAVWYCGRQWEPGPDNGVRKINGHYRAISDAICTTASCSFKLAKNRCAGPYPPIPPTPPVPVTWPEFDPDAPHGPVHVEIPPWLWWLGLAAIAAWCVSNPIAWVECAAALGLEGGLGKEVVFG